MFRLPFVPKEAVDLPCFQIKKNYPGVAIAQINSDRGDTRNIENNEILEIEPGYFQIEIDEELAATNANIIEAFGVKYVRNRTGNLLESGEFSIDRIAYKEECNPYSPEIEKIYLRWKN